MHLEDFTPSDVVESPEIFGGSVLEHTHYCIQMVELAVLRMGDLPLHRVSANHESKLARSFLESVLNKVNRSRRMIV